MVGSVADLRQAEDAGGHVSSDDAVSTARSTSSGGVARVRSPPGTFTDYQLHPMGGGVTDLRQAEDAGGHVSSDDAVSTASSTSSGGVARVRSPPGTFTDYQAFQALPPDDMAPSSDDDSNSDDDISIDDPPSSNAANMDQPLGAFLHRQPREATL